MLGSQVIWCGIPFGAITVKGLFLPVQDFTATSAVKIEADEETGWSKVTGRELQECCFSIRAQAVAGADPRTTFHLLDAMKGMSGNIYVTSGVSTSLTTSLLDALQTSDWRNIFSVDTAVNIIKGLLCGTKIGEVAYMLTAVEMDAQGIASNGDIYDATITLSFTEDVAMRQGGGLAVHINGKDITSSISVQACTYDMSAEGEADCLRLIFSDPTGVWAKWQAKKEGDTARITDGAVDSGSMFIDTLKPKDSAYELVAYSTPRSAFAKRSRSFNALSLPQLASKIASEHKLKVKTFSAPETRVSYTQQRGVGDLAFLHEQCQRAGAAFVVFDGTICLYGQKTMEGREAACTLTPGAEDKFTVMGDKQATYTAAELANGTYIGKATDSAVSGDKVYRETVTAAWASQADANAHAAAKLRELNKGGKRAELEMSTRRQLAAGSVVRLICKGWAGNAFVYRIRHDLLAKRSRLWVREPLAY